MLTVALALSDKGDIIAEPLKIHGTWNTTSQVCYLSIIASTATTVSTADNSWLIVIDSDV